jgi:PAS domain S-box-containing protein
MNTPTEKKKHPTPHSIPDTFREPTSWHGLFAIVIVLLVVTGLFVAFLWHIGSGVLTGSAQFGIIGALSLASIGIVGVVGVIVRDARRRLSSAARIVDILKESRDRYAYALESARTGTWEWNLSGDAVRIYTSERWGDLYGYTKETAPQTLDEWLALVHPEDREAMAQLTTHAIATNIRMYKNEYRLRTGSGEYVYVRDHGTVRTDEGNRMLIGSTHDETPIRTAEEILKRRTDELRRANTQIREEMRNTRKFHQAVESANDAIAITNPEGHIVYANAAWYVLIGMNKETAPKEFFTPFEEHTQSIHMRQLKKALKDATPFTSDDFHGIRPEHKDEAYAAEISMSPVVDDGKAVFFAIIAGDITQRKEIDHAKTEFVSLASHQLRTPLSAIRWYSEMLIKEMGGSLTETQKSYLQEVYGANLRMIELVNALLNVSRIDMGTVQSDPEKLALEPIVKSVLGELYPRIMEKKLTVKEEYAADIPDTWFDPKQMRMIFQNLLSNAVKYTPGGGSIGVIIRTEGENLFFSISDSGIGIPKEQQPQIFNKLFRADNAREVDTTGTGLGLYIIKSIIEKAHGSLRFESQQGTGTTFYGILPIQKEKPDVTTGSKPLV